MPLKAEVRDYITKLAQTLGVDSAPMLAKAEADENAAKFVEESGMLRSDYSRKQDQLTALQTKIDAKQAELDTYYQNQWLPNWNKREQEVTKLQGELTTLRAKEAAYKTMYGEIDGLPATPASPAAPGAPVATPSDKWMTREESAALAGTLAKEMTWVGMKHMREFPNADFDVDAFEQHVIKGQYQGKNAIRQAYEDYVKPQREAKITAERTAELEAAKKKGVEEWLAQHPQIPVDNGTPAMRGSQIFRAPNKEDASAAVLADPNTPQFVKDQALRDSFLKDLNGPITASGILGGR